MTSPGVSSAGASRRRRLRKRPHRRRRQRPLSSLSRLPAIGLSTFSIFFSTCASISRRKRWIPRPPSASALSAGFDAVSNGKLIDKKQNNDKTVTFHWLQDKPHVAYLITLVVAKFDIVQEDWNGIPVLYYVPKGRQSDVARSFGRTRDMLTFFSDRFGIKYPWDKYAQVVAEQYGGGMENTSATTLTDRALHDERSMLDSTP